MKREKETKMKHGKWKMKTKLGMKNQNEKWNKKKNTWNMENRNWKWKIKMKNEYGKWLMKYRNWKLKDGKEEKRKIENG